MILKLRVASLILIHILILSHVYIFGSDVVGSIDFQEFFHSFIKLGVVNAGVILVFIAFTTTLIFGRFFCGWACHFGAIQEFSWYILNKLNIKPKTVDSKLVTLLPFIILLNFYFIPNIYHSINNPWDEIIVTLNEPDIWKFLPGFTIGLLTFLIDGFLIVYFLGKKGFCRFICPWGAFLKFPNSLAFFKVRKTGTCTECHVCTSECPVGIDVSYEINNYNKVTNTNCTSCLNCTYGCPSNALSYTYENPIKEEFNLKNYIQNKGSYIHTNISNQFTNIRNKDFLFLIILLIISFSLDGLYAMGHFMAFGIGTITSFILLFKLKKINKILQYSIVAIIACFVLWHGTIKYSIWRGYYNYNQQNYTKAIRHLERATFLYLKDIGKFHIRLSEMYLYQNKIEEAKYHANKAKIINPNYESPEQLLNLINKH
tara:strand:- start:264 stop:1550 length:1287 start_codon:yes stop_codon:yes gene_type:complete